jgi:hypothetical protein
VMFSSISNARLVLASYFICRGKLGGRLLERHAASI